MRTRLQKQKNWWVQSFQIFCRRQTLFFVVVRTGPKAVYYSTTDLFLILGKGGILGMGGLPYWSIQGWATGVYMVYFYSLSVRERECKSKWADRKNVLNFPKRNIWPCFLSIALNRVVTKTRRCPPQGWYFRLLFSPTPLAQFWYKWPRPHATPPPSQQPLLTVLHTITWTTAKNILGLTTKQNSNKVLYHYIMV